MPEQAVQKKDLGPDAPRDKNPKADIAGAEAAVATAAMPAVLRPGIGLAAAGGRIPPAAVVSLQRRAGNHAVASALRGRPTVQRDSGAYIPPVSDEQLIAEGVKDRDVGKIKQVKSFAKAKFEDKISMIDILTDQFWVGPWDEWALEAIWGSFGEGVLDVASKNQALWEKSLKGGAELYKLGPVKPVADKFLADTRAIAGGFLDTNEKYTVGELQKLGVVEGDAKAPSEAEQAARATELTAAIRIAKETTELQTQLKTVPVALERRYEMFPGDRTIYFTSGFDPAKQPDPADENPPPDRVEKAKAQGMTDAQLARTPWKQVKDQWDMTEAIVQGLAIAYPAVGIAMMQPGPSVAKAAGDDAKVAKAQIVQMLTGARDAIRETRPKLAGGLAYELVPIHNQLFGGTKGASGTDWKNPVYQVVAKEVLELKQNVEFWKTMGLATLAAAAFILAEFATAGLASVALIGFGVGLGAGQAIVAWEKAIEMKAAEKATTGGGTELLASGQADMAAFEAALATIMVFVDAFMAAKPLGKAISGAVDRVALAAGAKAGSKIVEELAALAGKAPDRALAERAIVELGAENVIAKSGKSATELLAIVGENSPVAARLKALAAVPADLAKLTIPELSKRARQLAVEIANNRETGEAVATLALERFGPKQVVEMNGGWKNLSLALGNESATGKAIMAWRDGAMGDIEAFVKTLPGGVDETGKAAVKRTGTQGKFTNDFDVSLLGPHASANRNAVRSFAAGRFGTGVDRLNELLLADFFTDPRRLHLYDQLDPLLRAEVGARAEKVAEATIFAKTLHDAEEAGNKELAQQIREQMKALQIEEVPFKPLGEADRSALYAKLDDYHQQLEAALSAGDKAAQKDLVGKIGDAQGLINAAEGGGYFSGGATRQIVTLAEGLLKGSTKPLDAQVYTALLDQLPKLNEAASGLLKAGVTAGEDAVSAIKGIAKYGNRFRELLAKMEVKVADEALWDSLAGRLQTLLKEAKGETKVSLLTRLETDAKTVEAEVNTALGEFRASSQQVLMDLSRQAAISGQKVDLNAIQFLVMATAKLTRVTNAIRESLRMIVAQMVEAAALANKGGTPDDKSTTPQTPAPGATTPAAPPAQRQTIQRRVGSADRAPRVRQAPAAIEPVVQRDTAPTPKEAVDSKDPDKVSDVPIGSWNGASNYERRAAVMIMLGKSWMFPWNDSTVVGILNSYPDQNAMEAADVDALRRAVTRGSVKGPELTKYSAITRDFRSAIVERARQNVQKNLGELDEMAKKYGIGQEAEGGASGVPSAMDELQLAAGKVADARGVQVQLRKIQVGFKPMPNDPAGFIPSSDPMFFDPDAPPLRKQFGAGGMRPGPIGQQSGIVEWSRVKEAWDQLEIQIAKTMASNPALYILASTQAIDQRLISEDDRLKFGKSALSGLESTSGDQAKKELVNAHTKSKAALLKVQGKIGIPNDPVERNEVDVASLDELGLHVADSPRFSEPFAKWAAGNWLEKEQTSKERIAAIIDFATAVVLIGATVATAGGAAAAAAILAGAATAGAVASAGVKISNASDLRSTADAGIRPEDKLTSEVKASSSELEAGIAVAAALLAFAASIKAITGVAGAFFRTASTAEDVALIRAGKLASGARATKAISTSIREVGVLATAEQAGFGQDVSKLLQYLPEGSAEAKEVSELAKKLAEAGAVKTPEIDFKKALSASGSKSSLQGQGMGVFEGRIPGVDKPVAIKVYPAGMADMFATDMRGAQAAAETGVGPKFYGEVQVAPSEGGVGRRAFAMEKVEGGFASYAGNEGATAAEIAAGKKQAEEAAARVTKATIADLRTYQKAIIDKGFYYDGEVQGLITPEGRFKPIDFQPVKPLPPVTEAAARTDAIAANARNFDDEANLLQKHVDRNAAAKTGQRQLQRETVQRERPLVVQRDFHGDVVAAINNKGYVTDRDGDFKTAWGVLNHLSMTDMLATMEALRVDGNLGTLLAHQDAAKKFNVARLMVGVHVVQLRAAGKVGDPAELEKLHNEVPAIGDQVPSIEGFLRLAPGSLGDQHAGTAPPDPSKLGDIKAALDPASAGAPGTAALAWDGEGATPAAAKNRAALIKEVTAAIKAHLDRAMPGMKRKQKAPKLPMTSFEGAGREAKRMVDATFGVSAGASALTPAQSSGRTAFEFKAGTNLFDETDPKDYTPNPPDIASWIAETDPTAAAAQRAHHFDKSRPPEESFLDTKILAPFVAARSRDLAVYDAYGFATANPETHQVFATPQIRGDLKQPAPGVPSPGERFAKWHMWQTLVHEYIHVLEHPAFGDAAKGRRVMKEGFCEYFTREVLLGEIPKAKGGDPAILSAVEGTDASGGPFPNFTADLVPNYSPRAYAAYQANADKVAAATSKEAMRAAFFQGHVELIGLDPDGNVTVSAPAGSGELVTLPKGVTTPFALGVITGSSAGEIMAANPGLKADGPLPDPVRVPGVRYHTVVSAKEKRPTGGAMTESTETAAQIAEQNGVQQEAVERANPGVDWAKVRAGDRILIPKH